MERLLGSVDAAVYLLDYTKLKTVEEASLFTKLKARPTSSNRKPDLPGDC